MDPLRALEMAQAGFSAAATLQRFGSDVGFERLALLHVNDSRAPLGSNADRHVNIGEGHIGLEACSYLRADERVLRVRDLGVDAARREALRVAIELLEAALDEADLVGLVVDREVRAVAEPFGLATQDATARRVEGEDPDRAGRRADHALDALAHLGCRLVRERDREDPRPLDTDRADQVLSWLEDDLYTDTEDENRRKTLEEWPSSYDAILRVRQVMYTAYIGRCRVVSLIHLRGYLESGS